MSNHKHHKKNKFQQLATPEHIFYKEYDFVSVNGSTPRRYFYNQGSRSDVFGRTSEMDKWSNPYTAWTQYTNSRLLPAGLVPQSQPYNRYYNSVSYNYLDNDINTNQKKKNRKKIIPNETKSSSELLHNNLKVEKSLYNNDLRNKLIQKKYLIRELEKKLNDKSNINSTQIDNILINNMIMYQSISPEFFYQSPTKYTRDYFGSTLYKDNKSTNTTIEQQEKLVTSDYWIPKKDLPYSQGYGKKVFQKSTPYGTNPEEWWKYYPQLPFDYYNKSFL